MGNREKETYIVSIIVDSPGAVTTRVESTKIIINCTMTENKIYNGDCRHVHIVIIRPLLVT